MGHHKDQHQGDHDTGDGHPRGYLPVGFTCLHEEDDHDDHQYHNGDELLGDTGGEVTEAVEDALPMLQMHEDRDAADHQQNEGGDERGDLGFEPFAFEIGDGLGAERTGRPSHKRGKENQRPLEFH